MIFRFVTLHPNPLPRLQDGEHAHRQHGAGARSTFESRYPSIHSLVFGHGEHHIAPVAVVYLWVANIGHPEECLRMMHAALFSVPSERGPGSCVYIYKVKTDTNTNAI